MWLLPILCSWGTSYGCAVEQSISHPGSKSGQGGTSAVGAAAGDEEGEGTQTPAESDNTGGSGGHKYNFGPGALGTGGKTSGWFGAGKGGAKPGEISGATDTETGGTRSVGKGGGGSEEGVGNTGEVTGTAGPCTATEVIDIDMSGGQGHSASPKTKDGFCVRVKGTIQGWNCSNLQGRTITTYGETGTPIAGAAACNGTNQNPPGAWTDGLRYFDVSAGSVDYPGMSFF